MVLLCLLVLFLYSWIYESVIKRRKNRTRVLMRGTHHAAARCARQAKPDWVRRRVMYLAAHLPHAGCRTIAFAFNRWHSNASVGKTWVAEFMKKHAMEITALRRAMRSRRPVHLDPGHWALDLSYWRNANGQLLTVLGIVDQSSRRLLCLKQLPSKCALTLLGHLFLTMAKFGTPQTLRTDNEAMFAARWWHRALKTLHIQPRKGPPGQPWRNGRMERVFATLKGVLRHVTCTKTLDITPVLQEFSVFYNEMRPHQGLDGLTPLEAWQGKTMTEVQAANAPNTV